MDAEGRACLRLEEMVKRAHKHLEANDKPRMEATRKNLVSSLTGPFIPGGSWFDEIGRWADNCSFSGSSGKILLNAMRAFSGAETLQEGFQLAAGSVRKTTLEVYEEEPKPNGLFDSFDALASGQDPYEAVWDVAERGEFEENGAYLFAVLVSGFLGREDRDRIDQGEDRHLWRTSGLPELPNGTTGERIGKMYLTSDGCLTGIVNVMGFRGKRWQRARQQIKIKGSREYLLDFAARFDCE